MSSNYIFIPYNFDDFDFEQLRKEQRDGKGKILWEYGERCPKINKKDVCYIYCSNLPDMINRILIRAEVSEINIDVNGKSCFELSNIRPIRLHNSNSKDIDITYSYDNLIRNFGITTVQRKHILKPETNSGHQQLVGCLEHEPQKGKLNDIRLYYERISKCVFDGHDHNPKMHKTFITCKGLTYRETHHVILKEAQKEWKISNKDIEDLRNKETLCPLCHRKIHYGKEDEVRKMIDYLYIRRKDFYDECFHKYATPREGGAVSWLYELYHVN